MFVRSDRVFYSASDLKGAVECEWALMRKLDSKLGPIHARDAAVASDELRGASDLELYRHATETGGRVVTENVKDLRPLLLAATAAGAPAAALLLVPPRRFPCGRGDRSATIAAAIGAWLDRPDADPRPIEDWLT